MTEPEEDPKPKTKMEKITIKVELRDTDITKIKTGRVAHFTYTNEIKDALGNRTMLVGDVQIQRTCQGRRLKRN